MYLHCDPTASHYLKLVLDCVFGQDQFRNEIVWAYSGGGVPKRDFPRKHDVILRYAGDDRTFNVERKPYKENTQQVGKHSTLSGGGEINLERGTPVTDWWVDVKTVTGWNPEKTGWKTQKPLALLERIIRASTNEGDLVLDPFCGCATAALAAEKLRRQWIGIDMSPLAQKLVRSRLNNELGLEGLDVSFYDTPPTRTDLDDQPVSRVSAKHELYGRQEGICNGCLIHYPFRNMTVDHIVATGRGGADHPSNYQLLCGACNSVKGKKTHAELIARLRELGIRQ